MLSLVLDVATLTVALIKQLRIVTIYREDGPLQTLVKSTTVGTLFRPRVKQYISPIASIVKRTIATVCYSSCFLPSVLIFL